jgi:hypothetical protein
MPFTKEERYIHNCAKKIMEENIRQEKLFKEEMLRNQFKNDKILYNQQLYNMTDWERVNLSNLKGYINKVDNELKKKYNITN